jgi:hypothetical protein
MSVRSFSAIPVSVRILALSAASALILLMAIVVTAEQAAAQDSDEDCLTGEDGHLGYCETEPGDEDPGGSGGGNSEGGGGDAGPSCPHLEEFTQEWYLDRHEFYCEGESACWENDPPIGWEDEAKWPDPPSEDAGDYIYKYCEDPDGNVTFQDFTWENVPDEPSLEEQAQTAYGQLNAPPFTLAFNPPGEAVIYVETWLWAEDAPSGPLEGSSAFGLVAIAEPDHLEVDPGDGSGTITCDFVTSESDECAHTYERASSDGGYPARARLVYDVHFENDGAPIDIPGAPDTFQSQWQETAIPVTEVQSNVVR